MRHTGMSTNARTRARLAETRTARQDREQRHAFALSLRALDGARVQGIGARGSR